MGTSEIETAAGKQLQALQNSAAKGEVDLQSLLPDPTPTKSDKVNVSMKEVYKSLTVFAQKVLDKLQEILGDKLPDGLDSLKPEDHTAEKTAQRIVDGTTAMLGVFARQNPELEGEALISEFMKTIRGGIDSGYKDAAAILGDIGALQIDGVQSGIEETMRLVEEKLKAFEDSYRQQNGLVAPATTTSTEAESAGTETSVEPTKVNQVA